MFRSRNTASRQFITQPNNRTVHCNRNSKEVFCSSLT
uniref:Uncharacterized protein n=1 Tax=Anguilla anguilla TaxID=7936 RepID=A0A0E9XEQ0_ANGAN